MSALTTLPIHTTARPPSLDAIIERAADGTVWPDPQRLPSARRIDWLEFKLAAGASLVLIQSGQHFEAHGDDAEVIARALALDLSYWVCEGAIVQLVRVPASLVDAAVAKLVQAGYGVCVANEVGEPDCEGSEPPRAIVLNKRPRPAPVNRDAELLRIIAELPDPLRGVCQALMEVGPAHRRTGSHLIVRWIKRRGKFPFHSEPDLAERDDVERMATILSSIPRDLKRAMFESLERHAAKLAGEIAADSNEVEIENEHGGLRLVRVDDDAGRLLPGA
ncbi:MAG: hypothetical protein HZA51_15595 [Planctomycetes bacterium]|nr:hypothetical protein [Planctomycetota bacterium]